MEEDFLSSLKDCVEIDMEAIAEMPGLQMFIGSALKIFAPLF